MANEAKIHSLIAAALAAPKTNGDLFREQAEQMGLPLTSVWKAQEGLKAAKRAHGLRRNTRSDGLVVRISSGLGKGEWDA